MKLAKVILLLALRHGPAVLDAYTTNRGIARGATERNTIASPLSGTPFAYAYAQAPAVAYELLRWKRPHSTSTQILRPVVYIVAGAQMAAAVNNLVVTNRLPRPAQPKVGTQ